MHLIKSTYNLPFKVYKQIARLKSTCYICSNCVKTLCWYCMTLSSGVARNCLGIEVFKISSVTILTSLLLHKVYLAWGHILETS